MHLPFVDSTCKCFPFECIKFHKHYVIGSKSKPFDRCRSFKILLWADMVNIEKRGKATKHHGEFK